MTFAVRRWPPRNDFCQRSDRARRLFPGACSSGRLHRNGGRGTGRRPVMRERAAPGRRGFRRPACPRYGSPISEFERCPGPDRDPARRRERQAPRPAAAGSSEVSAKWRPASEFSLRMKRRRLRASPFSNGIRFLAIRPPASREPLRCSARPAPGAGRWPVSRCGRAGCAAGSLAG